MPLSFAPGEAYQFDWSHEVVVLDGITTPVKVAQMRLYSAWPHRWVIGLPGHISNYVTCAGRGVPVRR